VGTGCGDEPLHLTHALTHFPFSQNAKSFAFDGIKSKALGYCFDAFSSREPVSAPLENALEA
jgi:hypothetical protein